MTTIGLALYHRSFAAHKVAGRGSGGRMTLYTRGVSAGETERAGAGAPGDAWSLAGLDEEGLAMRGHALGRCLRAGDVVLLDGPMGAGKTTLTRAIARGLGVDHPERVQSPTFTLCMVHRGRVPLVHVDLFRLGDGEAPEIGGGAGFDSLGLDDMLADAGLFGEDVAGGHALVVEWGTRWRSAPADRLSVALTRVSADRRDLAAAASGPRSAALLAAWVGAASSS